LALNHEIVDPATGIVYYVDLAYPQQRIAIEHDGSDHVTDPDRVTHDHHKSTALHGEGWTVLRVHAKDLHDPTDVFARLDHAWDARAAAGGDAARGAGAGRGGGAARGGGGGLPVPDELSVPSDGAAAE